MATLFLNVGNFITLRLNPNNYLLWCKQTLALVESQELVGHLTNEDPTPNKYIIPNPSNSTIADNAIPQLIDAFIAWQKFNRLFQGWIIGPLFEKTLELIIGLDITRAVWEALENTYAQESQEHQFTLH